MHIVVIINPSLTVFDILNPISTCILQCRRKAIIDRDPVDLPSSLTRVLKLIQVLLEASRPRQQSQAVGEEHAMCSLTVNSKWLRLKLTT